MATQITPQAASDLGRRRRTPGGRLAAHRQLWSVAIIGALVLALAASLAIGRALQSDQASTVAGIDAPTGSAVRAVAPAPAEACVYAGADGTPGEGCALTSVASVAPTQPESCVYGGSTGIPDEGCAPPAAAPVTQMKLASCVYASAEGIPGEGCTRAEPATAPTR